MAKADELNEAERIRSDEAERQEEIRRASRKSVWERPQQVQTPTQKNERESSEFDAIFGDKRQQNEESAEKREAKFEEIKPESSWSDKLFGNKKQKSKEEIPEFEEEYPDERKGKSIDDVAEDVWGTLKTGAKKIAKDLKGKSTTEKESRRSSPYKPLYENSRKESGLKDIGKGNMGAAKYSGNSTPDFFGTGSGFDMGVTNPLGQPSRTQRSSPPSTKFPSGKNKAPSVNVPSGGNRAPSTGIPSYGNRPPSTAFPGTSRVPSTYVPNQSGRAPSTIFGGSNVPSTRIPLVSGKAPSTTYRVSGKPSVHVPIERLKPVSTKFSGSKKPSTHIPTVKGKPPSTRTRKSTPSTKIPKGSKRPPVSVDRPIPVKVDVKKQKNFMDEMGLIGYF
jgi:hypothetical protein